MTKQELFTEMDGQEVQSIQFEGCVAVDAETQTITRCYDGKVIKPTAAHMRTLFDEAFENEFGTLNVDELLKQEFGI